MSSIFDPAAAASAKSSQASNSVFERVKRVFTDATQGAARRGRTACRAFSERYAWETGSAQARMPHPRQDLLLCGMLFPEGGGTPVSLFEGRYSWVVEGTSGKLAPPSSQDGRVQLRIERDFLEVVEASGEQSARRFHCNESVRLGTSRYLLKIFDVGCRIPLNVEVAPEGVLS